jgi:hypothetical protein
MTGLETRLLYKAYVVARVGRVAVGKVVALC